MLELLKYDFFQNALISTLLIGISCGLVGTYIVAKRMVFISGGITHASFGGLGLSYYLGLSPMLGATAFSILSALGILFLSDSKKLKASFGRQVWRSVSCLFTSLQGMPPI